MRDTDRKVSTKDLARRHNFRCYPKGFGVVYRSYLQGAMRRGHSFDLTLAQFNNIAKASCAYCGSECENYTINYSYTGIDRIDNKQGYTEGNVQACCKLCNKMKGTLSPMQFIRHIRSIVKHLR